jgi:hypothetical protein
MSTSSKLLINEDTIERLSSIIIDIESQSESKEEIKPEIHAPIRSILIKHEENNIDDTIIIRLCFGLLFIVLLSPIIICDLYFGFNDKSCSREQPDELALSIRLYLIVSGFVGLSVLIISLIMPTCFDPNGISHLGACLIYCGSIAFMCATLFNIVWNILGAVIFWGYYGNLNCNKTFSTYVFISLIIKLAGNLLSILIASNKKKDDEI